jgi:hypothetical protein
MTYLPCMTCTTCKRVVQINNTGICLGCQKGFKQTPDDDAIDLRPIKEMEGLKEREKEIEDALQKQKAESVDVRERTVHGKGMGARNAKKRKAARPSQQEKINLPKDFGKVV